MTERNLIHPPGRSDLYNGDILRNLLLSKRTPLSMNRFLFRYIRDIVETKFHQFPKPYTRATQYCLNNIRALEIARPHNKLTRARQMLEHHEMQINDNDQQQIAS